MRLGLLHFREIPSGLSVLAGMFFAKIGAILYLEYCYRRTWIWVGRVKALYVYPVKSCRRLEVDSMIATSRGGEIGPVKDRHWMIIYKDGCMVSQRAIPDLALITPTLLGDQLLLSAPGMDALALETKPAIRDENIVECKLGKSVQLNVLHCGETARQWICRFLGRDDLAIVHLREEMETTQLEQFNRTHHYYARKGDVKGFHDESPYLLLTQPSIADLSSRLADINVDVHRFRPNILVDGCEPYEEDNWSRVRIGDAVYMTRIAMSYRCINITIDQDTASQPRDDIEPLPTLRTYRLAPEHNGYGRSPIMGVNLCPDTKGTIRVGDDVFAIEEHY